MRDLAVELVKSPEIADLVASMIPSVTKDGCRRLSLQDKESLQSLNVEEEDVMSAKLTMFLKQAKNIVQFSDYAREQILYRLGNNCLKEPTMQDIICYSMLFDVKHIKDVDITNGNLVKLALAIFVYDSDETLWYDEKSDAKNIERLYEALNISNSENNLIYLKSVAKLLKFME